MAGWMDIGLSWKKEKKGKEKKGGKKDLEFDLATCYYDPCYFFFASWRSSS